MSWSRAERGPESRDVKSSVIEGQRKPKRRLAIILGNSSSKT